MTHRTSTVPSLPRIQTLSFIGLGIAIGVLAAMTLRGAGPSTHAAANAAEEGTRARLLDPNGIIEDPYTYAPGHEALGPDEVRVIACGTGMPAARRGQAAACFVVELGNGDKFLFDVGTGSMRNVMALNIPADYLTRVFLSHLHTDHWGDLDCALGRRLDRGAHPSPRRSGGPVGDLARTWGPKYAIDHFLKANNWDLHHACGEGQFRPRRDRHARVRLQGHRRRGRLQPATASSSARFPRFTPATDR